ncbi:MAG: NAD(P)-dependent glycerol-3-phosphate dehydrogenase [Lachnospiraceae bacterium]|nr:NAD(P)-dependent glycerol-3-phosphate dehydrogenase [Lachnospiraceae bacterium]
MSKVAVLGGGGWACALAVLLDDNGNEVTIWSKLEKEVELITKERENKNSLPGVKIPESIDVTGNIDEAIKDADIIVMAVASSFVRVTAELLIGKINDGQIIVNVAKGIEDNTLYTMTDILEDVLPMCDACVLSGPTHAEEVGRKLPTTIVVGAKTRETAEFVQKVFSSEYFRVYISSDIVGIELGGSLKNVIALAAGIADGLGYGDNTKAALITRGIKEISELGCKMGGQQQTFSGLSGIGDLIVTCASMHSRNRRAGILIGQGKTLQEAIDEVHMVVEGAVSAKAALDLAKKYKVQLPIIEEVNKVLFEDYPAKDAVKQLMMREYKSEHMDMLWK